MKDLFIVRHGKSSWEIEYVEDIDRALTERGVRDSYTMGKRFLERGLVPDIIFSSPANRAFHTALIMARVMKIPEENIFLKQSLYLPHEDGIVRTIHSTPENVSSVALFGHNPAFHGFVNNYLKAPLENLPTAGMVVLSFNVESWKEIAPEKVVKEFVDCPKKKW